MHSQLSDTWDETEKGKVVGGVGDKFLKGHFVPKSAKTGHNGIVLRFIATLLPIWVEQDRWKDKTW